MSDAAARIFPVARADAPRWVELHHRLLSPPPSDLEHPPSVAGLEESVRPESERQHWLAEVGGRLVGLARTSSSPQALAHGGIYAFVAVDPEHQGHGVGSELYRTISASARSAGFAALVSRLTETEEHALAWARRRGFEEIERDIPRVLDLTGTQAPVAEPPAGIELTTLAERPELLRGLYEVTAEAEPDAPGYEQLVHPPYEEWVAGEGAYWLRRPEAIFLATAGAEVVGAATLAFRSELVGFHGLTAVRRTWRGRGVARALKSAQIAWAKKGGYERLETTNEVRNEAMQRLNASLGYEAQPAALTIRGPLA